MCKSHLPCIYNYSSKYTHVFVGGKTEAEKAIVDMLENQVYMVILYDSCSHDINFVTLFLGYGL